LPTVARFPRSAPENVVQPDGMLVTAAQRGDVQAFEALYRTHSARVLGLCLRMTRHRDIAEDCMQQAFIQAWRSLPSFEGRSAFGSWLHRIAVNEVLNHRRSRKSWLQAQDDVPVAELAEAEERDAARSDAFTRDDVVDVEHALAKLPDGARHVIVLHSVYGYTHEEVAEMLGVAVGTCKAQLHRGRRLLREQLQLSSKATG
jgi:RNA polymerase sigma-70 factor, ECF subfamily